MLQSKIALVLRTETEGFSTSIHQAENELSARFKRMAGASKNALAAFLHFDYASNILINS